MMRSSVFLIAAILAFCRAAAARELSAFTTLPYGVTPCQVFGAGNKHTYSDFSEVNDFLSNLLGWGELFQTTWCGSGGGARYTILAPTNKAVTTALAQLHGKYGTAAKASAFTFVDYPLGYQNNPVQIAWDAIMENHFIPFPVDFYTNKTVLAATKDKPLVLPTYAAYVHNHIKVWTEKGVVYGGIPNGLVHGEASFVIPKPQPELIIGPYEKGDDSKIFIYPIDTLLVPHTLPVPFASKKYTHGMANYLKAVGPCATAYPSGYTGTLQKGCHPT